MNDDDMKSDLSVLRCPSWLEAEAKSIWAELVPLLESSMSVEPIDAIGLAILCQQVARWRQAEAEISKNGVLLRTGKLKITAKGTVLPSLRVNPATRYADAALKQIKALLVQYGLTPRARSTGEKRNPAFDELDAFNRGD